MSEQRLTSEQWATLYGWQLNSGGMRFWAILLAVLVIGAAVGTLVVPPDVVPGFGGSAGSSANGLEAANGRINELEAQVLSLRDDAATGAQLRSELDDRLMAASDENGIEMALDFTAPALIYTVRAGETQQCADFVLMQANGEYHNVPLTPPYDCAD